MKSFSFLLGAAVLAGAVVEGVRLNSEKNRPVTKVIKVLEKMMDNLSKDGTADAETQQKFSCWCAKVKLHSTKDIENGRASIVKLQATIESSAAAIAASAAEIEDLSKKLKEETTALKEATELRRKQLAEFNEDEKDKLVALEAVKAAIKILSKHHSLLEVRKVLGQIPWETSSLISETDRSQVAAFMQGASSKDFYDAKNTFSTSYAPQSGVIFGILKNMYDNFKANLSTAQNTEIQNSKDFAELKKAKEELIEQLTSQLADKEKEHSAALVLNAEAKDAKKKEEDMVESNSKFLADANMKCQKMGQSEEKRKKERANEVAAVQQALKILREAGAHGAFTKTFNPPTFLQLSRNRAVIRASDKLMAAGRRLRAPKLTELAALMQTRTVGHALDMVFKAIDKMIAELTKDQKDEVSKRDYCVEEFQKIKEEKTDISHTIGVKRAGMKDSNEKIAQYNDDIEKFEKDLKNMHEDLAEAKEEREEENKKFQAQQGENLESRDVLRRALLVLKTYYQKNGFLQAPDDDQKVQLKKDIMTKTQKMEASTKDIKERSDSMESAQSKVGAAPAEFAKAGPSGGGNVISMIESIMNEAEELNKKAELDERDSKETYDKMLDETTDRIEKTTKLLDTTKSNLADENETLGDLTNDHDSAVSDKEANERSSYDAHNECDFLMKNFDVRQEQRAEELKALDEAKGIIGGAMGGTMPIEKPTEKPKTF